MSPFRALHTPYLQIAGFRDIRRAWQCTPAVPDLCSPSMQEERFRGTVVLHAGHLCPHPVIHLTGLQVIKATPPLQSRTFGRRATRALVAVLFNPTSTENAAPWQAPVAQTTSGSGDIVWKTTRMEKHALTCYDMIMVYPVRTEWKSTH